MEPTPTLQLDKDSLLSLKESYLSEQGLATTQIESGLDSFTTTQQLQQDLVTAQKPQPVIDTSPVTSSSLSPLEISPTQASTDKEPTFDDIDIVSDINIGSIQQVITRPTLEAEADLSTSAQNSDQDSSPTNEVEAAVGNANDEADENGSSGLSNGILGAVVGGLSGALIPKPQDSINVDLGPVLDAVATLLRGPIRNAIASRRTSSAILVDRTDNVASVRPTQIVPIPKFARVPTSNVNLIPVGGAGQSSRLSENGFIPLSSQQAFPDHILPRVDSNLDVYANSNKVDSIRRPQLSQVSKNNYITNNGAPIVNENDPHIFDILSKYEHSYLYSKHQNDPLKIKIVPGTGAVNKVPYQQNKYSSQGQTQGGGYNAPPQTPPPRPNGPPPQKYGSHVETPYSTKIKPKKPQQNKHVETPYSQPIKHQETGYSKPIQQHVNSQHKENKYSKPIKHAETPYTKPVKPQNQIGKPYKSQNRPQKQNSNPYSSPNKPFKQPYQQRKPIPTQKLPYYNRPQNKGRPVQSRPQGPPPGYAGGNKNPQIRKPAHSPYRPPRYDTPKPEVTPPPTAYKTKPNTIQIASPKEPPTYNYQTPNTNTNSVVSSPDQDVYVPPSVNAPISSYASPQTSNIYQESDSANNQISNNNKNGNSVSSGNGYSDSLSISNAPAPIYTNSFVPVSDPSNNYPGPDISDASQNSGYKSSTRPPLSSYSGAGLSQTNVDESKDSRPNFAIITPVTRPPVYSNVRASSYTGQPQSPVPANPFLYSTPQTSNEYTPIIVTQAPSYRNTDSTQSYSINSGGTPIPGWGSAEVSPAIYDNSGTNSYNNGNIKESGSQQGTYTNTGYSSNTQYNQGSAATQGPIVYSSPASVGYSPAAPATYKPLAPDRYTSAAPDPARYNPAAPAPARYTSAAPAPARYTPAAPAPARYTPAAPAPARYTPAAPAPSRYSSPAPSATYQQPSTAKPVVSTGYSKATYNSAQASEEEEEYEIPIEIDSYKSNEDGTVGTVSSNSANQYNAVKSTTKKLSRPTTPWYNTYTTPRPVYKYQSGSRKRVDTVNYPVTDKQYALAAATPTDKPNYGNRLNQQSIVTPKSTLGFNNVVQPPARPRPVSSSDNYQNTKRRKTASSNTNNNYNPRVEATTNKISRVPYPGNTRNTVYRESNTGVSSSTDTGEISSAEVQIDVPSYGVPDIDNNAKINYDPRDKNQYVDSKRPRKKYYSSSGSKSRRPVSSGDNINDSIERVSVEELEPSFTVSDDYAGNSYTRDPQTSTSITKTKLDYQG